MNHLKLKLQELWRNGRITFTWRTSGWGVNATWELVDDGEISLPGQAELVTYYSETDPSFWGEALADAEKQARVCLEDGDDLALGRLIRDHLRKTASDWAMSSDVWGDIVQMDLEHEKARWSQAGGF